MSTPRIVYVVRDCNNNLEMVGKLDTRQEAEEYAASLLGRFIIEEWRVHDKEHGWLAYGPIQEGKWTLPE